MTDPLPFVPLADAAYDVVIVGAGHAGAEAAIALRQQGFAGSLALVGDEAEPPYERPPLSKEYLKGDKGFDRLLIRPLAFWHAQAVTLLPGTRIVAIDAGARRVVAADGRRIGYRELVWAAGGSPRTLACAGADLAGVHAVRRRTDVDAIIRELPAAARVVVIGGGYVGLEAAAVLAQAGKEVTVVEALPRVLARVAGEPVSRFYGAEHRRHGVALRLDARVTCLEGRDGKAAGRVASVVLADGDRLPADMVIVGIGIVPAIAPLADAGAATGDGVLVDAACRTSLPHVHAIGDCAAQASTYSSGVAIRLESVANAHAQAAILARAFVGAPPPVPALPWFWSNQYDLKLQTIGLSRGYDAIVLRGDPATRSFSAIYLRESRVIALDCINRVRDYVQGRGLIAMGTIIAPELLADEMIPLKAHGAKLPMHGKDT